ncbi:hypothetical protein ACKVMT_12445 [Halobacteriales archaeon Cl-PHB]
MTVRRVASVLRAGATEFRRTPVLLALLVFLPAYAIGVFTLVAPEVQALVHLPGGGTVPVDLAEGFPAFTTPMTAALVTGIAGLFVMQGSADTDRRLVVAGFRARQVVLGRLGLLVGVAAVATAVAVGVMLVAFDPAHLGWYLLATVLTALTYGTVGVLAGLVLGKLAGIYLVMFGAMVDLFIFQNPLAAEAPPGSRVLPGHFPTNLAIEAGFAESVSMAPLTWSLAYLLGLAGLAMLAFYGKTRSS